MGEGIQITIPDFDNDDYSSTPTPFGKSAGGPFGFGGGFGGGFGSSGLDSPTLITPVADRGERSYFPSHSRVDSVASVDSTHSSTARHLTKPLHSSHSSIASPVTAFSKKPSFASIRNAFKGGKNNDPPPVPSLDHPYPILNNPFNRSTSSLNRQPGANPPFPRPSTPGASTRTMRTKYHAPAKSYHSQSGSIFHASDGGSDPGHGHPLVPSSPPPVPRMPDAFGLQQRSDTPPISDEDENIMMDPKTPSDFALHAVFIRFAALSENVIDKFLRHPLEPEPLLPAFIGTGVTIQFDETLQSLAKIAQRHAKPVVDSIMRWRRSQHEPVTSEIINFHATLSPPVTRSSRSQDVPVTLRERKSLASIYVMCRALIAVTQSSSKDSLGEALGRMLEETTFDQFRNPDVRLLTSSANHRVISDLYATLLGHIANIRFMSVTDRFLAELDPVAQGQVPKDSDIKYGSLLRGLKHIQIKVWPPEAFEEGAEFMESLSKSFVHSHGQRFKTVFAEILTQILHPIGKTAQAETNNPEWAKAIEMIYPRAKEMMSKPRYWPAVFPLAITSLCMAHQSYFLKHWSTCFDAACSKLKEKPSRVIAMNGIVRLIWTYLYRCQEPASTTITKLDSLMKHFFPPNRLTVFPQEDCLEQLTYLVHFVLSRHPEFGQDLCLELLQESLVQQNGGIISPERVFVGVQALILSLHVAEKDTPTPVWPSTSDFSIVPSRSDYPLSSEFPPPSLLSKAGVKAFLERCGATLAAIAISCGNAAGHMLVFDDQWSHSPSNTSYEEPSNYVTRRHQDGPMVAYPSQLIQQVVMLQTCFQAWPRCLHASIAVPDALDMLLRGVAHVEPSLGEASCQAVKRFMADGKQALTVLQCFADFLFSSTKMARDCSGVRLALEFPKLLDLWINIVEGWIRGLLQHSPTFAPDLDEIVARCVGIQGGALFLMTHETRFIHVAGVKVIRLLGLLIAHPSFADRLPPSLFLVQYLHGRGIEQTSYLCGYDELLESPDLARLEQWRQSNRTDVLLRIADSTNEKDRKLWSFVFPAFLQAAVDLGTVPGSMRETIGAAASRYHPLISHLAGLSARVPAGLSTRTPTLERDTGKLLRDNKHLVDQWRIWVKVLCATATLSESSRPALTSLGREHTRAPSDVSFERERLSTTRGLFRYLTPFLDSEFPLFRDTAVLCISLFPPTAYPQLLEDLSLLAGRQFYDDPRSKAVSSPALEQGFGLLSPRQYHDQAKSTPGGALLAERTRRQERLHSAVAQIYYLTAHYLQLQRSAGRQAALANVLKFVRNTQSFLIVPEVRENPTLQKLRRYFCGTVERLFDGLAALKDSDRFIPSHMHLTLYRLCEEWCQLGPQFDVIQKRNIKMFNVASLDSDMNNAKEHFKIETSLLSAAAAGALTSLCRKAFYPPDMASSSPTERLPPEYVRPLTVSAILERLSGILSSSQEVVQAKGKKGLRSLLASATSDMDLLDEALRRAVLVADDVDTCNSLFFETITDIICNSSNPPFSFSQSVCLGLSNLRHPHPSIRHSAFRVLEAVHQQFSGLLALSDLEAPVCSRASGTYTHAHHLIAEFLAGEHPDQAANILTQIATWLPNLPKVVSVTNLTILLLQSLEFWIPSVSLMPEDRSTWSPGGLSSLYHLLSLTLHYGQTYPEQILTIWSKLVESPHLANGHATVRFLLEQSHKVGSAVYIRSAANVVACLCQTSISQQIFQELSAVIEPARMLPTIEHKLKFPDADDADLWGDLGALFEDEPRLPLGSAQFAWLFLTDVAIQRSWELKEEVPALLHALFTHIDHRTAFVRERAQHMLFQCLRAWAPEDMLDRSCNVGWAFHKSSIACLEEDAQSMYWKEEDSSEDSESKIKWLSSRVLEHLRPLRPSLAEEWGSLALHWSTTCSIRGVAFRSLQIFRALMPRVKQRDLAILLGRLSNTISAADENLQSFTEEILQTITALTAKGDVDWTSLPQIFWCACASLSTTIQKEFSQVLELLDVLLAKVDLDDEDSVELLLARRPSDWQGLAALQPGLLKGLRSSRTAEKTIKVLCALAKFKDNRVIDPSGGRVRDLYTLSLPWSLHAMASEKPSDCLRHFAENISVLASNEGKQSISKIMASFAKNIFRTRDDFLRQSVASLREHYAKDWTAIATLLLSFVLNGERWIQVHAMQVLKVLFQQRDPKIRFDRFGSELLMPLLRLLETDLAPQALDVLEEPVTISGGAAAKHVLRMSMHIQALVQNNEIDFVTDVFGVPDESGWSIARPDELRETCRSNVMAVFDTCSMPTRPSRIEFEPEVEALASPEHPHNELDGLMKDLQELTSFFQDDETRNMPTPIPAPSRRLEARVAAILAKSTASNTIPDMPQTPFLDVFSIAGVLDEDSDEYSDTDSEPDAFIFDSPTAYRSDPNSYH